MRGHTVLEVLLTVGLLTLLLMAVLTVYVMGMRAWVRGDNEADRLAAAQVACARLAGEVQESLYSGLQVRLHALACLSPRDGDGKVSVGQADGVLAGQRYLVWWSASGVLYRRELAGLPSPLEAYLSDGVAVVRSELTASNEGRLVTLHLYDTDVTVRVRN